MAEPNRSVVEPGDSGSVWGVVAALVLLALVLAIVVSVGSPPEPKPKEVPLTDFSAGRAREVLRELVGDGTPHPVGSPANARVREKVLGHLRWLGYAPEVQEGFACHPGGSCGRVWNVLARLQGREAGKAVMLVAHYDSVPSGPGVGDDLAGVAAVLEVARVLKTGPPPRRSVFFLIDDGEEGGLLGARAFVEKHPAVTQVGAVVNLEARGTAGPSLMFETSGDDAWLVRAYAARASRPFTSSLFPTIYQFLPNDTDLTVFKRRGVPGLNFAFIENPSHYHRPLDNFANVSPASLQHHGDNALAAVQGLVESDLANPSQGGAVFFDVLHRTVVQWPAGMTPVLAAVALLLILAAAWLAVRRGLAVWKSVFFGLLVPPAAALLTLALAFGLQALLAGAFPMPWVARPLPVILAFWLLSLAVTLGLAGALGRNRGTAGLWAGVWTAWALLGLLLSLMLPGVSYLFVAPALVAGACGLVMYGIGGLGLAPWGPALVAIVPALAVGLLWFPLLASLYLGMGLPGLMVAALLLAFVFSTLTPLSASAGALGQKWLPAAAAVVAVLAAVTAMVTPPFSPDSPRTLVLQAHQDADTGTARWLAWGPPPLPEPVSEAGKFARQPAPGLPWLPPSLLAFVAPAPNLSTPGPTLTVLADSTSGGKRHLSLKLVSLRGAPVGTLAIPAAARAESVAVDGYPIPEADGRRPGPPPGMGRPWRLYTNLTLPAGGTVFEVVLGATEPMEWYVFDRSYGLPPAGQALIHARPEDAAPIQEGDNVVVSRKVKI